MSSNVLEGEGGGQCSGWVGGWVVGWVGPCLCVSVHLSVCPSVNGGIFIQLPVDLSPNPLGRPLFSGVSLVLEDSGRSSFSAGGTMALQESGRTNRLVSILSGTYSEYSIV